MSWLFLREQLGGGKKKKRGGKKANLAERGKIGKRCLTVPASLHMRKLLYGRESSMQSFRAPPLIADDLTSHFSPVGRLEMALATVIAGISSSRRLIRKAFTDP